VIFFSAGWVVGARSGLEVGGAMGGSGFWRLTHACVAFINGRVASALFTPTNRTDESETMPQNHKAECKMKQ